MLRQEFEQQLKIKYQITDKDVLERINTFRTNLKEKLGKELSPEELMDYLQEAMNCDEVQLRSVENYFKGIETTIEEDLQLLFETSTDEQIFMKYAAMTNVDEVNLKDCLDSIEKQRGSRKKDDQ